ncbi:MAG: VWA domain-containing protein [Verrucomicrobiia bacterium]
MSRWFPDLRLARPWRLIPLLLLTLALARPFVGREEAPMTVWVVVDRSDSAGRFVDENLKEWRGLLEQSKPKKDTLRWLSFAHDAVEGEPDKLDTTLQRRDATKLRSAVEKVLAHVRTDVPHRILLVTDGFSTESLDGISRRLANAGVPMDVRLVGGAEASDWRAIGLRLPNPVGSGESVMAELEVAGPREGRRSFIVRQNGKPLGEGEVTLRRGLGRARFILPPLGEGSHQVEVEMVGKGDPQPLNNRAVGWTVVGEQKGILLITSHEADPLVEILSSGGRAPQVVTDARLLHPGILGGVRTVIFNNVPAGDVNSAFLQALPFHVETTGAGLVMFGGKHSFGSGGYFESPVDPLLPVSMELRKEHRKLLLTMAIMLDRSGSMMAPAGGGRNKMDMANDGTARAIEMLQPADAVAVFAVDTRPHPIIKLRNVGEDRNRLMNLVRRIESEGGGIYVYEALRAGWEEIRNVEHGTRHMILFSDAADSEEPGDYERLLAETANPA